MITYKSLNVISKYLTKPYLYSFIGIIQSLPMTSYIKMVDIWMIFMMLYPFFEVCLYTLMEVLKNRNSRIEEFKKKSTGDWINRDFKKNLMLTRHVHFALDWGLPIVATIFIMLYWVLGILNTESRNVESKCYN